MNHLVRACIALIGLSAANAAQAECSVSADQGARARTVSPIVKTDADLVVSMSMVPKLTHVDYKAASQRPTCDLGPLAAESSAYQFWASDSAGRQRKALPVKKGQPIATVIPVFDILKAIDSAKTRTPAPIEGYMLAVVTKGDFTGWRFYTGMPEVEILKHDMVEALSGAGTPIFRNGADGKTAIFVPKG